MERIALDIMGPLPVTHRGNKYILCIGDYFTKWMEAVPLPNQEASTIADALIETVSFVAWVYHDRYTLIKAKVTTQQ